MRTDICVERNDVTRAAIRAVCEERGIKYLSDSLNGTFCDGYIFADDDGARICGGGAASGCQQVSLEEFIAAMLGQGLKPKITEIGGHKLTYTKDSVRVGCTTVTREQVEGVLDHMNALRDKK